MIWSGDTTASWESLPKQVVDGLSAASTGFSKWTLDIGGFQGDPTISWSNYIDDPQYRELYSNIVSHYTYNWYNCMENKPIPAW